MNSAVWEYKDQCHQRGTRSDGNGTFRGNDFTFPATRAIRPGAQIHEFIQEAKSDNWWGRKGGKTAIFTLAAVCSFPRGLANERLKGPSVGAENAKAGSQSARRLGLCFSRRRWLRKVRRGDRGMEGEDNEG